MVQSAADQNDTAKSHITRSRQRNQCTECSKRRIKCDMLVPCHACRRAERTCILPDNSHLSSRSKKIVPKSTVSTTAKEHLDRLEKIIERLAEDQFGSGNKTANRLKFLKGNSDQSTTERSTQCSFHPPLSSLDFPFAATSNRDTETAVPTGSNDAIARLIGKSSYASSTSWVALNPDVSLDIGTLILQILLTP